MKCKQCGSDYDVADAQRVFGDADWTHSMCSASCYTESVTGGFKCKCGNREFIAHQVVRMDAIVNGHNDWQRSPNYDTDAAIYDSETPYGPYTCTKCGAEYGELK